MDQLDHDYTATTTGMQESCPLEALFTLLSGPWTCLIIWHLSQRPTTRFLELKRQVGKISAKILTERLRMLESAGIVERQVIHNAPQQVHYSLSQRGQELRQAFTALQDIAKQWGDLQVRKSRNRATSAHRAVMSEAAE